MIRTRLLTLATALLLTLSLATPAAAAFTPTQVSAILSLLASFGADQATIDNVRTSLTGGTPTLPNAPACTFTRDLAIGTQGPDVTCLQQGLIEQGFAIPAGATGYFGLQTRTAVIAWQRARSVAPAAGYFGPFSRRTWASQGAPVPTPPANPPVAATLSASRTIIRRGESATLTWSSANATSCTGTNFGTAGATAGTLVVSPRDPIAYALTCTGPGGSDTARLTIEVETVPGTPLATLQATPASIVTGGSATLTWSSLNATSCTGTNFTPTGTAGSLAVTPTQTTTYTLACTGPGGTTTREATVTVGAIPDTTAPTVPGTFTGTVASPTRVDLSWIVSTDNVGVTRYEVYRDGAVLASTINPIYSDTTVSAGHSYVYKVRAYDAAGNASAFSSAITLTVTNVPAVTFTADPLSVTAGQTVHLAWSATDATSCTGTNFGTGGAVSGAKNVVPTQTTTYTLACTGPGGTATKSATVTVAPSSFAIGVHVKTTAALSVRAGAGTGMALLCVQPLGATGILVGGPKIANGYTWWNIDYASGCDGWSVEEYLGISVANPPTVSFAASPTTITAGKSATLTWSTTDATSCTGTGFATSGAVSGTKTVTPTQTTTYTLACTGPGGTTTREATVTVGAPAPAPTVSSILPSSGAVGSTTVITGTNFTSETTVVFERGGVSAAAVVVRWTTTTLKVTVPLVGTQSHQQSGLMTVTVDNGNGSATGTYTIKADTTSPFISRSGATLMLHGAPFRFAGANIHNLGLKTTAMEYPTHYEIKDALDTAVEMGATVVRTFAAGSSGCAPCIEPSLNTFNDAAFEPFDYALSVAKSNGIRFVLPLIDYGEDEPHGSISTFSAWFGLENSEDFYADPNTKAAFKTYIAHVLNHVNPYTGLAYKDDPAIMAWETGNELIDKIHPWDDSWTEEIAQYIKSIAPRQLVADGHTGGLADARGDLTASQLALPSVDLYAVHSYPRDTSFVLSNADQTAAAGKVFYLGEYETGERVRPGRPLNDNLTTFLTALKDDGAIAGDLFWNIMGHADDHGFLGGEPSDDNLNVNYPGTDETTAIRGQALRTHAFAMRSLSLPPHAAPLPATLTSIKRTATGYKLDWRGGTLSRSYTVERAPSSSGPWQAVGSILTDWDAPWIDTSSATSTAYYYRLVGTNYDGSATAVTEATSTPQ
jgi:uncharacterized cupredoxin-like copper-binding protein